MKKDEKIALWLVLGTPLWWLFGVASFGVTGGHIITVIIANTGIFCAPFAFFFGLYLLIKAQIRLNRKK